jgi:hypothetical protein
MKSAIKSSCKYLAKASPYLSNIFLPQSLSGPNNSLIILSITLYRVNKKNNFSRASHNSSRYSDHHLDALLKGVF